MSFKAFIKRNNVLLQNFSYITILQIFLLIAPLITYPYLVKVLGRELYGLVLTAQMLASFASLIIDFGSNSVCAKHVSIHRDNKNKLSEIVSSVFWVRFLLFFIVFLFYMLIVFLVPSYREYYLLFLLTYGLTLNDLLFPQYFFQGIEHMKEITIISILTRIIFIALIFVVVKSANDYFLVPLLYTTGYAVGGFISLFIIFKTMHIQFYRPPISIIKVYVKDSAPIFATELISTIKDKLNYMFVGILAGMENVIIYDLGLKLNSLITKPLNILRTVLFPRFVISRDTNKLKRVIVISLIISIFLVIMLNIFLPFIVQFFINESIDLFPIRLFLLVPIMLSVSSIISSNLFVAFGYNKYVLYSIIITTIVYIISLIIAYYSHILNTVYSFIFISLISYFTELVYRLLTARKVIKMEGKKLKIS